MVEWSLAALKEHYDEHLKLLRNDLKQFRKNVSEQFIEKGKAIDKAEEAQKDYNTRSNEFRGQLDDQAKTLMPRAEAISKFDDLDKRYNALQKDLATLRENRRTEEGNKAGWRASGSLIVGVASVMGILILIATTIVTVALFISRDNRQLEAVPVQIKNTETDKVPVKQ